MMHASTIAEQLRDMAARYNAAVAAPKIRPRRLVAEEAHKLAFDAIQKLQALPSDESELIAAAEAMLMDIRWGRPTSQFGF